MVKELQVLDYPKKLLLMKKRRSLKKNRKKKKKSVSDNVILVDGVDDILTRISHCCMPVPGDDITGFITAGHGISIHKSTCPNLLANDPNRLIDVSWAAEVKASHRAKIQVVAHDQKGLLATLSNAITTDDANILNMEANTSSSGLAKFNFILEISSRDQLIMLLQHLQQLDGVIEAKRK